MVVGATSQAAKGLSYKNCWPALGCHAGLQNTMKAPKQKYLLFLLVSKRRKVLIFTMICLMSCNYDPYSISNNIYMLFQASKCHKNVCRSEETDQFNKSQTVPVSLFYSRKQFSCRKMFFFPHVHRPAVQPTANKAKEQLISICKSAFKITIVNNKRRPFFLLH